MTTRIAAVTVTLDPVDIFSDSARQSAGVELVELDELDEIEELRLTAVHREEHLTFVLELNTNSIIQYRHVISCT